MECRFPPQLTDDQISDLIDGTAASDVQAHLAGCPYCRERYETAMRFEGLLRQRLNRFDCPSSDMLRDYALDLLAAETAQTVGAHVQTCPRCQGEIADLRQFLSDDQPAARPLATARPPRRVPSLPTARPVYGAPSFAMRGDGSSEPLMLEVDGIMLFLEVQNEGDGDWLLGRLSAANFEQWEGALVEVWQEGQLQAVTLLKEGGFRCRLRNQSPLEMRILAGDGTSIRLEKVDFNTGESPG
jgi:hypothetical protein